MRSGEVRKWCVLLKTGDFIIEDVENKYQGYMVVSTIRKKVKHRDMIAKDSEK